MTECISDPSDTNKRKCLNLILWKTAFRKFEEVWSALGRPCPFSFFKECLPQILLGQFLNNLSQIIVTVLTTNFGVQTQSKSYIMYFYTRYFLIFLRRDGIKNCLNPLWSNPTKWSNTQQIVWVGLTILWELTLKGLMESEVENC